MPAYIWQGNTGCAGSSRCGADAQCEYTMENNMEDKNKKPAQAAKPAAFPGRGRVAIVKCGTYDGQEVQIAVQRAVELLGGLERVLSAGEKPLVHDSRIILKPNLLAKTEPEKACTTHPAVFKAVGALLQENGYKNLRYGDSPGNPMIGVERVAQECGIKAAADSLGIPLGEFESGTQVAFPQGRAADSFVLCDEVIKADGIINICKMKTHQLERITGAVKNTFGCVYGINKGASHAKFATAEVFAKMLADLNALVRPKLHIMDGIMAMEGNGPQSGTPTPMGVILASTDPVALDAVFCHLVDLKPELVPTNVSGMEQGIGTWTDLEIIDESGTLTVQEAFEKYGSSTFNVQRGAEYRGMLRPVRFLAPLLEKKPIVRKNICIGCGICVNACPVEGKAIHVEPVEQSGPDCGARSAAGKQRRGVAVYDYSKCIKCYCCQEMCPEQAITLKKSLLARIADRNWRI